MTDIASSAVASAARPQPDVADMGVDGTGVGVVVGVDTEPPVWHASDKRLLESLLQRNQHQDSYYP